MAVIEIRTNVASNLVGRCWGIVSVYVFTPFYLSILGREEFGMVGFFSLLLGVLTFADLGFTATINREVARLATSSEGLRETGDLFRTYETIYLLVITSAAFVLWVSAPWIVDRWLNLNLLPPAAAAKAVRAFGIAACAQMFSGLYLSGLMGLQRQLAANTIQVVSGVIRGAGAVAWMLTVDRSIESFAMWHAVVGVCLCLVLRQYAWAKLPRIGAGARFSVSVLRRTWRYSAGMATVAILAAMLAQLDKLLVSKLLSLELFGFYTLASAIAAVPLTAAGAVGNALFPRFSGLVAVGDSESLVVLYRKGYQSAAAIVIPAGVTLAFFAGEVAYAWTGSITIARQLGSTTACLVAAQTIQALTTVPYFVALAKGQVRTLLWVQVAMAVVFVPLLVLMTTRLGLVGAGFSWLAANVIVMLPYMYFLHRRSLPNQFFAWLNEGVLFPAAAAALPVGLCWILVPEGLSRWGAGLAIVCVSCIATLSVAASLPWIRREISLQIRAAGSRLL